MDPSAKELDPRHVKALALIEKYWQPHSGQQQLVDPLFNKHTPFVYVECGRKFGKSEFGVWACWRWALTYPKSEIYYLVGEQKQAKEIVWASERMQTCNTYSDEFVKAIEELYGGQLKIKNDELRIIFPNKSFIKIDGSDNYERHRGYKPDLVIADEYRDFKPGWIGAMRPNMAVKHAPFLFLSTPPTIRLGNPAYEMVEECRSGDPKDYFYLRLPSKTNDRIPGLGEWIEKEKNRLLSLGRDAEYYREYEALFVEESEAHVLPGYANCPQYPDDRFMLELSRREDMGALDYLLVLHTGDTTWLAALLLAYDQNTGVLWICESEFSGLPAKTLESNAKKIILGWQQKYRMSQYTIEHHFDILVVGQPVNYDGLMSSDGNGGYTLTGIDIESIEYSYWISTMKELIAARRVIRGLGDSDLKDHIQAFIRDEATMTIPNRRPQLVEALLAGIDYFNCAISVPGDPSAFDTDMLRVQAAINPECVRHRMSQKLIERYGTDDMTEIHDMYQNMRPTDDF